MPDVPTATMNNGITMPQIGFGVFRVPGRKTMSAVLSAMEAGYRQCQANPHTSTPAVNQVELHPRFPQEQLRAGTLSSATPSPGFPSAGGRWTADGAIEEPT